MHQSIGKKNKITLYFIFLFVLSTTSGKFQVEQKNYSSKINKIDIVGLSNNKNLKILDTLNNFFYQNILMIKKNEINKIITKHNIIEEFSIRKIYPSRLDIKITATKLVAKISGDKQLFVGANGKLIINNKNDIKLPYIFGEFNSKEFLEFKRNIDSSKFNFIEFKKIYFFPSNRWDILTNDDILIKLPQKNIIESLSLAHSIISNDQFIYKNIVDLRISNQLILK
jgi:cell division protein FtsQ